MNKPRYAPFGIAVAVVFVLSAAALYTSASSQSSNVINGCANNRTSGQLRVVSSPAECKSNETAVSWNQQGPQGPPGATGPQGPAGAQGPPGSSPYTFQAALAESVVACDSPPCQQTVTAECPADFIRVSVIDCFANRGLTESEFFFPASDKSKITCEFKVLSEDTVLLTTRILCVSGVGL